MCTTRATAPEVSSRRHRQNVGGIARTYKGRRANLWFFHSNKRNRLISVLGDVLFAHIVMVEMDPSILTYRLDKEDEYGATGKPRIEASDLTVYLVDATHEIWRCRRNPLASTPRQITGADGALIRLKTSADVERNRVLFDNSLYLCAALTAARNYDCAPACHAILNHLWQCSCATVAELTSLQGFDRALLYAGIARLHMERDISVDLHSRLLCQNSTVVRFGQGGAQ